jgi:hypothetical protein
MLVIQRKCAANISPVTQQKMGVSVTVLPAFMKFYLLLYTAGGQGSSVSIVSDYGLDDRGSIPNRGRGFFF